MASTVHRDRVTIPDAPAIPGLTFRRFRDEADFEVMAAIIKVCRWHDQIERVETAQDIARKVAWTSNYDPDEALLFAEVRGEGVAFSVHRWEALDSDERVYIHSGFILPEWRRKGLGRSMLHYSERRLHRAATEGRRSGASSLQSTVADTELEAQALLREEGYAPVRHWLKMVRDLTEPIAEAPMPLGLEVRPVKPEEVRKILHAADEAFRDHWGHRLMTEEDVQRVLAKPTFNPKLWKVAWDGDQVAGMVLSYVDLRENVEYQRKRGHNEDICVRRPWRRLGLARALITQSLRMLRAMDMEEAALGVDAQNPTGALRLYGSLAYRPVKRFTTYRKPMAA